MGWFKSIKKAVKKVTGVAKDASGVINAIGDIAGANKQAKAISSAADTEAESARYALDLQERMFNQQNALQRQLYDEQIARQEPFRLSGLQAQTRLNTLLGLGPNTGSSRYGKYAGDFSMQNFQADPGYAFRMSEGLKSLDRQAAARGGLISGGALKAAQRYGQDLGSQEYQNAFDRYQINRANQLQPLQSLMGAGQTATNQLAGAAGNYGTNAGNIAMTGGANQANAYLTKGNIAASQYGT